MKVPQTVTPRQTTTDWPARPRPKYRSSRCSSAIPIAQSRSGRREKLGRGSVRLEGYWSARDWLTRKGNAPLRRSHDCRRRSLAEGRPETLDFVLDFDLALDSVLASAVAAPESGRRLITKQFNRINLL